MKHIDNNVTFPLTLTWEDGSKQTFSSVAELECNLEDFDSSREPECQMIDAEGFVVGVKVSMTWVQLLQRMPK